MEMPNSPSDETLKRVRSSISEEELRSQVERICRSDTFDGLANLQRVLRYLVKGAIDGRAPSATDIARGALGNRHPIRGPAHLRQEMKTLRPKLAEYYKNEAKDDDIWLDIPERQYNVFWKHSPKTLLGVTEFRDRKR